ncbi:MAG: terpene cyclase/mutase family protein [Planctomycetes bacterium]|nr:terpene cyclase/mutase family protein [Planctomycetota bacterium]
MYRVSIAALCAVLFVLVGSALAQREPAPLPPEPERKPEGEVEFPKDEGEIEPEPAKPQSVKALAGYAHRVGVKSRKHADRIKAALDWLKDHQNVEGHWNPISFGSDSKREEAKHTYNLDHYMPGEEAGDHGWAESDVGLTGLSMLAFFACGYNHRDGDYKEVLRRAIMYLRKIQGNDGCLGPKYDEHYIYNHGMAAAAMCEAYGLTNDTLLKAPCEYAVKFILNAQNEGKAWRYGVKPDANDTSVTSWMISALHSAKLAGIEADYKTAYAGATSWLDDMTGIWNGAPKTGYYEKAGNNARLRTHQEYENNPAMDGVNIFLRALMGEKDWNASDKTFAGQVALFSKTPPSWQKLKIDYYYWYYATLALFQAGEKEWDAWEKLVTKMLLDHQRGFVAADKGTTPATLDEHGSWDAVDCWAAGGGRVYSTAINCLTLSVYDRYKRVIEKVDPKKKDPKKPKGK